MTDTDTKPTGEMTAEDVLATISTENQDTTVTFVGPVGAVAAKRLVKKQAKPKK